MPWKDNTYVRFCNNNSKRWDGKASEILAKPMERTGSRNAEGLEEAVVHWPAKGKGKGKFWRCVILPEGEGDGAHGNEVYAFSMQ